MRTDTASKSTNGSTAQILTIPQRKTLIVYVISNWSSRTRALCHSCRIHWMPHMNAGDVDKLSGPKAKAMLSSDQRTFRFWSWETTKTITLGWLLQNQSAVRSLVPPCFSSSASSMGSLVFALTNLMRDSSAFPREVLIFVPKLITESDRSKTTQPSTEASSPIVLAAIVSLPRV